MSEYATYTPVFFQNRNSELSSMLERDLMGIRL
jgi:hypothetical protein